MDDTQKLTQNVPSQQNLTQGAQPSAVQPVSGGPKEAPKMPSLAGEWVSQSTPEVILPQEVKDIGVETKNDFPQLTTEQKAAGLRAAKEATEVKPLETTALSPKTPRVSLEILKQTHKKVTDSFAWLVRLIIREQDKQAHETGSGKVQEGI